MTFTTYSVTLIYTNGQREIARFTTNFRYNAFKDGLDIANPEWNLKVKKA